MIKTPLACVPDLCSVKPLEPSLMYAYALEMKYSNGDLRYYYLKSVEEWTIPKVFTVDGARFDEEAFWSVKPDGNGGVCFSNGYHIPAHILYYHSFRQQVYEQAEISYEDDNISIRPVYKEPLDRQYGFLVIRQYVGKEDELFGAFKGFVDENGSRRSPVSLYSLEKSRLPEGLYSARVAPTAKYGVLKADGAWLVPPLFSDVEGMEDYVGLTRTVNDKKEKWILSKDMKLKKLPGDASFDEWCNGLIRVNTEKWEGKRPYAGFYDDDGNYDLEAGKWGVINQMGEVVVEPKYVYLIGFWQTDGHHSIVARYVDGELLWGAIDRSGKETVPCQYPVAYTYSGNAVGFKRHADDPLYGLMDFNGNILFEPKFPYIENYDAAHRLATVGDHEDALGVYSVDRQEMVLPTEYDYIEYGERIIECEIAWEITCRYFDYDFNELHFEEYDSISERNGLIQIRKNRHFGLMDFDGNILIPPVLNHSIYIDAIDLYKAGYIITDKGEMKGLSKTDGMVILPPVYSEIYIIDGFITALHNATGNFPVAAELYRLNGTKVLSGAMRDIHIDPVKHTITVDTPTAREHLKYIDKDKTSTETSNPSPRNK